MVWLTRRHSASSACISAGTERRMERTAQQEWNNQQAHYVKARQGRVAGTGATTGCSCPAAHRAAAPLARQVLDRQPALPPRRTCVVRRVDETVPERLHSLLPLHRRLLHGGPFLKHSTAQQSPPTDLAPAPATLAALGAHGRWPGCSSSICSCFITIFPLLWDLQKPGRREPGPVSGQHSLLPPTVLSRSITSA